MYNIIKKQNLLQTVFINQMDEALKQESKLARFLQNIQKLEGVTVLLIFLFVVIIVIYLIAMLLIFFRKFKNIFKSRHSTKVYYLSLLAYIITKMILCTILLIHIISSIPNQWEDLKGEDIQIVLKNSIQLADLTILQLFFIALYFYLKLCFLAMDKNSIKKWKRSLLFSVKLTVVIESLAFMVPLIVFDCKLINYELLNFISTVFNCLAIAIFLASFFFLNFKMTGLMVEPKLNTVIKKIYKVLVIILVSRILMVAVELTIAFKIHDGTFESFMQFFQQANGQFVTLGMCFIGAVVIILLTEGLPIMYSLKKSVLEAFTLSMMFKDKSIDQQSMISSNTSVITDQLLNDKIFQYDQEPQIDEFENLSMKRFKNLIDLKDKEDSIWTLKRGQIGPDDFILKLAKHQISSYIIQDVQTEVSKWKDLKLTCMNTIHYFKQNDHLCIVEKFLPFNLDTLVEPLQRDRDIFLMALQIAKGIQELHRNEIVHGSLKPSYILFDMKKKLHFTGLGLLSLKKYLSLITGYTNKTMYSAPEILADKNNITIKATKQSDVYSFGMIFYEMITKNRVYREQSLKQCKERFCEQKARPKISENMNFRAKALIRSCWQDSPIKRPNISEVILNLKKGLEQL